MIIDQYSLDEEGFPPQKELPARLRCGHGCCGAEPADGTDDLPFCLIDRIEQCSPSPHCHQKAGDVPVSACPHGEREASASEARLSPELIMWGREKRTPELLLPLATSAGSAWTDDRLLGAGWLLTPRLLKYKHSRSVRNSEVIRYAPQASAEILRPHSCRQAVHGTGRVPANVTALDQTRKARHDTSAPRFYATNRRRGARAKVFVATALTPRATSSYGTPRSRITLTAAMSRRTRLLPTTR